MIKGSCFCGLVKFSIEPPTHSCFHCHCESCRKSHGAPFVTWASVPYSKLKINEGEGIVKAYESSLNIFWGFCSNCGTSLYQRTHRTPEMVYVSVATLTDPLDCKPDAHMCFSEHVDWFHVNDGIKTLEGRGSEGTVK